MTSATTPESGTTSYSSYDGNGNLLMRKDARNITTTCKYDAQNRLTSKTYTDGTPSAQFFYDNAQASRPSWSNMSFSNVNAQGRLLLTCTGATAIGNCNIGSATQVSDQKGGEAYDLLWYPFGTQWTTSNNETLGSFGDTIFAAFPPLDRGDYNNDGYFRSQEGRLGLGCKHHELLVSQRHHRISACRSPGREVARQSCDAEHQRGGERKR